MGFVMIEHVPLTYRGGAIPFTDKMLGRALDPHANGAWLSKPT